MLAWYLCDLSGDPNQYCSETLYFCDFSGVGGVRTPSPPLDPQMHDINGPDNIAKMATMTMYGKTLKKTNNYKLFKKLAIVQHLTKVGCWLLTAIKLQKPFERAVSNEFSKVMIF